MTSELAADSRDTSTRGRFGYDECARLYATGELFRKQGALIQYGFERRSRLPLGTDFFAVVCGQMWRGRGVRSGGLRMPSAQRIGSQVVTALGNAFSVHGQPLAVGGTDTGLVDVGPWELGNVLGARIAGEDLQTRWEVDQSQDLVDVGFVRPLAKAPPRGLMEHLIRLEELPYGWDGSNGLPAGSSVVGRAIEVLNYLYDRAAREGLTLKMPEVGPTPDGSIQFEWDDIDGFLTIEIPEEARSLSTYLDLPSGRESEQEARSLGDLWEPVTAVHP